MNIILFRANEIAINLPITDRRIQHLKKVVKIAQNEYFDAGIINESVGKAYYEHINEQQIKVSYQASTEILPTLWPVHIILGMVRPVNIQRIVRDLCSLGVEHIHLVQTNKSEKSYLQSKAYHRDRLQQYVIEGAEQAFSPYISQISIYKNLIEIVDKIQTEQKFAFDNYEFSKRWSSCNLKQETTVVAIGSERGWSNNERDILKEHNYILCSLGKRVLRTETAVISAVSVFLSKINGI